MTEAERNTVINFEVPKRQTLSQQVVEQLTGMIVSGQLPPGSLLPSEGRLAGQLGVSRMVIRESVRILAALGLVNVQHGVGTFVSTASTWRVEEPLTLLLRAEQQSLLDWLEIRMLIETGLARLAARRVTTENLEAMKMAIERMRTLAHDPKEAIEVDFDFHQEVARATANSLSLALMRPVLQPLREHLWACVRLPQALQMAVAEHEAIYAAIAAQDPDRAAEAMQVHLTRVIDEIKALHSQRELPVIEATWDKGDGSL